MKLKSIIIANFFSAPMAANTIFIFSALNPSVESGFPFRFLIYEWNGNIVHTLTSTNINGLLFSIPILLLDFSLFWLAYMYVCFIIVKKIRNEKIEHRNNIRFLSKLINRRT